MPLLTELLSSEDPIDREFALNAFMTSGTIFQEPGDLRGLFALLHSEDVTTRSLAARVLTRHAPFSRDTGLPEEDAVAAAAAAHVLAASKEYDAVLHAWLPDLIRDPRKTVHFTAVGTAQAMMKRAEPLVPLLLEIAVNPPSDSHVDSWAINALVGIAPDDVRLMRIAVAGLLDPAKKDLHPVYRSALLNGRNNAARQMAEALNRADVPGKVLLLKLLGQLGGRAVKVVEQIRGLMDDLDPEVSSAAAKAISPGDPFQRD